jgi:hypothetical protein
MATQLAIVKIDGKHYYQDDRLREYRETTNPHNSISFNELGDREPELVQEKKELGKQIKRRLR